MKLQNLQAEQSFLGSICFAPEMAMQFPLHRDDFTETRNKILYDCVFKLAKRRIEPDIITVSDQLESDGLIDEVGGISYIAEIMNNTPTAANAGKYREMIRQASSARKMRMIGQEILEADSYSNGDRFAAQIIDALASNMASDLTIQDAMQEMMEMVEERSRNPDVLPGLTTGLKRLDESIGGWQGGDLNVIAARSKHGKTAFMMNCIHAPVEPQGVISGEQPAKQLAMRSAAISKGVSLHKMRLGKLEPEDFAKISEAVKEYYERKIFIYDQGRPSIADIESQARSWAYSHGIKVLWVDYIQLITGGEGNESRTQIGDVANRLKALAKDLDIAVNVLAQVPRDVDKRPDGDSFMGKMPYQADIADSAKIENAADLIMTLYRPEVYHPKVHQVKGFMYANICKNRHGPEGKIPMTWIGQFTKLYDYDPKLHYEMVA